jgi:hypothetical protein
MPVRTRTSKPTLPATKRFLVLFYRGKGKQTEEQWEAFVDALHAGDHLFGGSELAKPSAIKGGKNTAPKSPTVEGYMIITAPGIAKVRALMKKSPTHLCGGSHDIFPLIAN